MIHPSAIIEPTAVIGDNVKIGPFSYIGGDVHIGDNSIIESHVVVKGPTQMGKNNHIFQYASVGEACQDKKYANEPTQLIIGDNNIFRECVTVHRGTVQDLGKTVIGSNNLFMAYVHIAHDCVIGDNVILANNATIAGHVHVGDWAIMAGFSGAHQFVHIGAHSFCSINSMVVKDVPPYVMASGHNAKPRGINTEGLKRRGFDSEQITQIRRAYKAIYRSENRLEEALECLTAASATYPEVKLMTDFISNSTRGIIR